MAKQKDGQERHENRGQQGQGRQYWPEHDDEQGRRRPSGTRSGGWQQEQGYGRHFEGRDEEYGRGGRQWEDDYERDDLNEREQPYRARGWQGQSGQYGWGEGFGPEYGQEGFRGFQQGGYGQGYDQGFGQGFGQGGYRQRGYYGRGGGFGEAGFGQQSGFGQQGRFSQGGYGQGGFGGFREGQGRYTQGGTMQGGQRGFQGRSFGQGFGQGWQGSGGLGYGGGFRQPGGFGEGGMGQGGGMGQSGWGQGRFFGPGMQNQGGPFRGRGPKGFIRSDERLKEMISELLTDDDQIDASNMMVEVRNGEVTLTGSVDDRWTKYQIEEIIEFCGCVNDIHNNLRVKREGSETQSDRSDKEFSAQTTTGRSSTQTARST